MKNLLYLFIALGLSFSVASCGKCRKVECDNGGECVDGTCDCPAGFSGESCEIEDLCITQNVTCVNGECEDGECDCDAYYYGATCNEHCVWGTYSDGDCKCNVGFEGDNCETYSRDKFIGNYTYTTSGCTTEPNHNSTIEADEDLPERVILTNISTDGDTKGYAEINGDTLWIPEQNVKGSSGTWKVVSTAPAIIASGKFTLEITRKAVGVTGATPIPCVHEFTMQ